MSRPTVGIFYDFGAIGPLQIGRAADGVADLLFVMDMQGRHGRDVAELAEDLGGVVDAADTDLVERALRRCAGITTFSDSQLLTVARHAERLGLPQHDPATALALTDKRTQRERLAASGLPGPEWISLPAGTTRSAADKAIAAFGPPVVVKPARGTGSRLTFPVTDSGAASAVLGLLFDGAEAGIGEDFIVERMWQGAPRPGPFTSLVSVETVSSGGRHTHMGITERLPFQPPLRESGSAVPDRLDPAVRAELHEVTIQALNGLGVRHGVSHTEFKLTPHGPRLIEVNGRLGGFVDALYQQAGIANPARAAILAALGAEPEPIQSARLNSASVIFPVGVRPPRPALVADTARELRALPGVWAVEVTDAGSADAGTMSSPLTAWVTASPEEFPAVLRGVTDRLDVFTR